MSKGILGLEIFASGVRYTYLQRKQRGFILSKSGKFSPPIPTAVKEPDSLARIIQGILKQENIFPAKICLSLSGEDLLIHQINLPKMTKNELDEVIRGEIERIPKFSNKEFDYIYSVSKLNEQKLRILFGAVTKDNLDAYIQGLQRTGTRLEGLEISPLNLLEILYAHLSKDKAEVLLVLDSHSSSMMIFWQNECKIFFQMAAGKSDLYLPNYELNKSAFLSWVEEIKRVLKSYQREFGMRPVERFWFIWDNERSQDLSGLLGKELEMEVTPPKLENFALKLSDKEPAFNPIFLLSLAGPLVYIKGLRQKFNSKHFLRHIRLKEVTRKVSIFVLSYMLLLGSLLGMLTVNYNLARKKMLASEEELTQRIATLETQTMELRKERDNYLDTRDRLLLQAAFVRDLNRVSWSEIFARISSVLPENVSLSSFKVSESQEVKIEGATFAIDSIAEMIRKINASSFLEEVQFDFLREREIEDKRIVEFSIVTKLKAGLHEKK